MVDATIIHATPSTKNRIKARDPEMHQTMKGNQWYFGVKIHVGANVDSGIWRRDLCQCPLQSRCTSGRPSACSKSRLGASQKQRIRQNSAIRSRVKHPFQIIKWQFGFTHHCPRHPHYRRFR